MNGNLLRYSLRSSALATALWAAGSAVIGLFYIALAPAFSGFEFLAMLEQMPERSTASLNSDHSQPGLMSWHPAVIEGYLLTGYEVPEDWYLALYAFLGQVDVLEVSGNRPGHWQAGQPLIQQSPALPRVQSTVAVLQVPAPDWNLPEDPFGDYCRQPRATGDENAPAGPHRAPNARRSTRSRTIRNLQRQNSTGHQKCGPGDDADGAHSNYASGAGG